MVQGKVIFFANAVYGTILANVFNFAFAFLQKLLMFWLKANLWSNLTPKSFSQINEFSIWI